MAIVGRLGELQFRPPQISPDGTQPQPRSLGRGHRGHVPFAQGTWLKSTNLVAKSPPLCSNSANFPILLRSRCSFDT